MYIAKQLLIDANSVQFGRAYKLTNAQTYAHFTLQQQIVLSEPQLFLERIEQYEFIPKNACESMPKILLIIGLCITFKKIKNEIHLL